MEGLEGNIGGLYTASNATRVGSVVNDAHQGTGTACGLSNAVDRELWALSAFLQFNLYFQEMPEKAHRWFLPALSDTSSNSVAQRKSGGPIDSTLLEIEW